MFGLFGLMGVVAAGFLLDAVMVGKDGESGTSDDPVEGDADPAPDDPVVQIAESNVSLTEAAAVPAGYIEDGPVSELHRSFWDEGMPQSSDLLTPPDLPFDLAGTAGQDVLNGAGGDDRLRGFGGNDVLSGGAGDDRLSGGAGRDALDGGDGDDRMRGGVGDDWLRGGAGDDLLWGNGGEDTLDGWDGDDTIAGGGGADLINGGSGADLVRGGDGSDTLSGGAGADSLFGGSGDDEIDGGDGNDVLTAGEGIDLLNGGAGDDVLVAGRAGTLTGGDGADEFVLTSGETIVTDYDRAVDRLVVVYDVAQHQSPVLTIEDRDGDAVVKLDGSAVAVVTGGAGLTASDIVLRSA